MATYEWYNGKSLAEDSHTINDSSMYDNTCSFTTMPKFKKGDVIICNKDCNISGNSWKVEKGEIFYVQGADWNSYWVRVVYSDCGTKKDFSILAEEIDDNCSLYQQSEKQSSNSYFPNLSNV